MLNTANALRSIPQAETHVPFLPLSRVNAPHQMAIAAAVTKVLQSGWYINGQAVNQFQNDYAAFCDTKYAIGTGNGLDALTLIFEAYKHLGLLAQGDEVIVPANSFIASALAISKSGLNVVFADINPHSYNLDLRNIKKALTSRTKAVLWVHLYGQLSISAEVIAFCKKHQILIIEDAAQSVGAKWNNLRSGAIGDAAAVSFYPGKNLGALGDAGAVTTNNPQLAEVVKTLANYGSSQKYVHIMQGANSRLDELQAAILSAKLPFIDHENAQRRTIANWYLQEINSRFIALPLVDDVQAHVFHLFVVRSAFRDQLKKHLEKCGVETLIHYPIAIHKQAAYAEYSEQRFPFAEQAATEILSLPIYPGMTSGEVNAVINACNSFRPCL